MKKKTPLQDDVLHRIERLERENRTLQNQITYMRRRKLFSYLALAFMVPFMIIYAAVTKPHTFADGEVISAAKMNENFDTLFTTAQQRTGTYCGKTSSMYTGITVGGYTGGREKCQAACNNSNAHMCTSHELAISAQLGVTISADNQWIIGFSGGDDGGNAVTDCAGFTSTSNSGSIVTSGRGEDSSCTNNYAIACCL